MTAVLEVLRADLLVTIQDLGRPHAQRYGVPLGGALDRFALVAANRLVGNGLGSAAIEITAGGAAFGLLQPVCLALTGADLGATLDGLPMPGWTTVYGRAGQELHIAHRQPAWGARAYLAVAGGVDVPDVLGARSTCLPGGFGGLNGRPLRRGDRLQVEVAPRDAAALAGRTWPTQRRPAYAALPTLRVLPGPHHAVFTGAALAALTTTSWQIGPQSNRTGYRLGDATLGYSGSVSIASHGVVPGAIQVPPDGAPILLMADAQTTGGYPIIAVVIGADLPLAAQLLPGDQLRLTTTTPDAAVTAWRTLDAWQRSQLPEDAALWQLGWAGAGDLRPAS